MAPDSSNSQKGRLIANFLGYQFIWFFTVWCINKELFLLPLLATGIYIFGHFLYSYQKKRELLTIGIISLVGVLTDMCVINLGILQINTPQPNILNMPYWLIGIWIAFSQLIPYSLNWITRKKRLAVIGGAIFGPLAYTSAIKLNILGSTNLIQTTIVLSIVWAILMYIFIKIIERTGASNDSIK